MMQTKKRIRNHLAASVFLLAMVFVASPAWADYPFGTVAVGSFHDAAVAQVCTRGQQKSGIARLKISPDSVDEYRSLPPFQLINGRAEVTVGPSLFGRKKCKAIDVRFAPGEAGDFEVWLKLSIFITGDTTPTDVGHLRLVGAGVLQDEIHLKDKIVSGTESYFAARQITAQNVTVTPTGDLFLSAPEVILFPDFVAEHGSHVEIIASE